MGLTDQYAGPCKKSGSLQEQVCDPSSNPTLKIVLAATTCRGSILRAGGAAGRLNNLTGSSVRTLRSPLRDAITSGRKPS